uniref:Nucleoside-diphosphate kinase n=1 Tax=Gasterosteus aculeatus aculeatus TaxID=481459 RepID=G3NXS8_GASAC
MGDKKRHTLPKRIFINDVDRYSSMHIAKFLSTSRAGGEDSEEEEADTVESSRRGEAAFQIVGTVSPSSKEGDGDFLLEKYTSSTRGELLERLLECDVVVYNISESATQQPVEEATWAITALSAEMENFKSRKMFILVSSVMTWAMTKAQNPEESGVLLTEEQFRRRRPHPNFRKHNNVEKVVLELARGKKSKLVGYVVGSGLQYGKGENLFNYFFKESWLMQFPKVPLFGKGTNHIPTIHVNDLAGVIQNIVELKPKSRYILAVDDSKNTLEDIVKVTLMITPMQQYTPDPVFIKYYGELEYLNINLRLDAFIIKDSFSLHWTSEAGMVENMASIVEEYKDTRQLLPIRICLAGPPAVGKSTIAEKLCSHYKIHHIKIKEVIEENLTQLLITLGLNNCFGPLGRLSDHLVFDILKEKLNSQPCRNQGFVLDGFPRSYEQARLIFSDEDTEDQDLIPKKPHVFVLDATDDFLTKRALGLPQSVADEMRYTQEEFVPRLTRYRQLSTAEETLPDYFDEQEIHPQHIEVTTDDSEYTGVMQKIIEIVGIPKNYGPSAEELEEEDRKRDEERKQKETEEAQRNLSEVERQEHELLEAHSLPLRNYLMKYVMPPLSEAMLDCSKIKPEEPVEFLAEHLLRNNQQP